MWRVAVVVGSLAGCEWNSVAPLDAPDQMDAHHSLIDAADDGPPPNAPHLLLTEIALAGTEFIEIANPTTAAVDLSNYYLSDNGSYFSVPTGSPVLNSGDFVVRFPAASSIAAGGVITVAVGTAAAFTTTYGAPPTYSIKDGTVSSVFATGLPSLTDAGEIVVLFEWDGTADLVHDVDMMLAGAGATGANGLLSKSGLIQGASNYAPDANSIAPQGTSPATGKSTKRIMAEGSNETQDGTGNGLTGHDETSEDTSMTWDSTFTAPTPGTIPSGL